MLGIKLEKRAAPTPWLEIEISVLAVVIALLVGSIVLGGGGFNPLRVYWTWFGGAFGGLSAIAKTITKMIPLLLVGVGLALAFRAGVWNIGAPGQMIIGAIAGTAVALFLPADLPAPLHLTLIFVASFVAGAGLAALCAFLNYRIGFDMVLSTLLLNYVAFKLLQYLVFGPWRGPVGFPYTATFPASAQLPLFGRTSIHYPTLIIGIVLAVLIFVLMERVKLGYEIKVFGENPRAATYAGISKFKVIMLAMIISGGLAGLAGAGEITGVHHMLKMGVDGAGAIYAASYGYIGIIVAWLAGRRPLGVLPTAFFVAGILVGGHSVQVLGLSYATVSMLLGLIFLSLVAGAFFLHYKVTFRKRGR